MSIEHPILEAPYHEAGHAIVGYVLGQKLSEVSRRTTEFAPKKMNPEAALRHQITLWLTGPLAQDKGPRKHSPAEPSADRLMALESAEGLSKLIGKDPQTIHDECEKCASDLLDSNWAAVEALAAVLMKRECVSGQEAMKIIDASLDPRT